MSAIGDVIRKAKALITGKSALGGGKAEMTDLYNSVASEEKLPPAENEAEVAAAVLAIFLRGLRAFEPWHKRSNDYRKWYRGEVRPDRPSFKTNANMNVIFSDIATVKPIIKDSLIKPGLFAVHKDKAAAGQTLDQRVSSLWRGSNFQSERASTIIQDLLVDGVKYFKTIYDGDIEEPRAIILDNRRCLHDPDALTFDESLWIGDAVLASIGETKAMFKNKAKNLVGSSVQYAGDDGKPKGPPSTDSSRSRTSTLNLEKPVAGGYELGRPDQSSSNTGQEWTRAEKIIRFELWFWDRTEDADGKALYPCGRIVTVAIGANKEGNALVGENSECLVLDDRGTPKWCHRLAKLKHKFPFDQVQCHEVGELWGLSEVHFKTDLQQLLNDAVNQTHDNWRSVNSGIWFVLKKFGLSEESFKNRPGHVVTLTAPNLDDVRKAALRIAPEPIANQTLPLINFYRDASNQTGGQGEILKGRPPPGVTSGIAIDKLSSWASGRFVFVSQNINACFIKIYFALACMVQDLAEIKVEKPGELVNYDKTPESPDRYVNYDPGEVVDVNFKVEATRQLTLENAIQLLSAAADLDSKGIPGMGALALSYSDDKGLMNSYTTLVDEAKAAQAKQQQDLLLAEKAKQDAATKAKLLELAMARMGGKSKEKGDDDGQKPESASTPKRD